MKIRDYIKFQFSQADNKLEKKKELAELFGVSEHAIHSWATGWRHPERKRWQTIILKTNGIVTLADLALDNRYLHDIEIKNDKSKGKDRDGR